MFFAAAFLELNTRYQLSGFWLLAYLGFELLMLDALDRYRKKRRGVVRANDEGLWFNGRRVARRERVRFAFVTRLAGVSVLRLHVGRGLDCVEVELDHEDDGRALLSAMRLDPARCVARFHARRGSLRSSRPWMALAGLLGVLFAGFLLPGPGDLFWRVMLLLECGAFFAALPLMAREASISIGADSLVLRRVFRTRVLEFSSIVEVTHTDREVHIRCRDGRRIVLHSVGKLPFFTERRPTSPDATEIARQIRVRMESARIAGRTQASFARAGRSVDEWMRDAEAVLDGAASYRDPAIPADEAWRVVEDPRAGASARVGAALALRPGLDEPGRARLRVTAEATAAPHLRVALEILASDKDVEAVRRAADRASKEDEDGSLRSRT